MSLPRKCERCGKRFIPYSPATKLCDECWEKASKHSSRRSNKKSRIKENKKHPYKNKKWKIV